MNSGFFFQMGQYYRDRRWTLGGSCYKLRYANLISASVAGLHRSSPTSSSSRPRPYRQQCHERERSMEITSLEDAIRTRRPSPTLKLRIRIFLRYPVRLSRPANPSSFRPVLTLSLSLFFFFPSSKNLLLDRANFIEREISYCARILEIKDHRF